LRVPNTPLDQLTFAVFSKLVKTKFQVHIDAERVVEMELAQVISRSDATSPTDSFSLIFLGPLQPALPQKMFLFEHAELGTFHLFIVPIARTPAGMEYEALFNRTKPKVSPGASA
jgi:hypothetical protein